MKNIYYFILDVCRNIIAKKILHKLDIPKRIMDIEESSKIIYDTLNSDKPCMITRFGSTELNEITSYIGFKYYKGYIWGYIWGKTPKWWTFNINSLKSMHYNSGFFPLEIQQLEKFAELSIKDIKEIDILGSWRYEESYIQSYLANNVSKVALLLLEPFWSETPWSRVLKNKKVLVIHPFSELIEKQYKKRKQLFTNKEILPEFELITIKAVQSIENSSEFNTWFEALEFMKNKMDNIEYDICLIGAGAYGMPLAAHAKRKGKKAIHLGGALQLLFGIRGKRWDNPNYGQITLKQRGMYIKLFNEHWVYPGDEYKPSNSKCCDGNCYWK